MTYNELIYMVLDELKISSDDAYFTKDHILFLLNKYRSFLLKQRYADVRKQIPDSNYQEVCIKLKVETPIEEDPCSSVLYLRSTTPVPTIMSVGSPRVYPRDFFQGEIAVISKDRLRYVGHNKYLKNIIYCAKVPDGFLYFKSANPQHKFLEAVNYSGIFEDAVEASKLACLTNGQPCEIEEQIFPIETALVPPLLQLVVQDLRGPQYSPEDEENNAKDDLSEVQTK